MEWWRDGSLGGVWVCWEAVMRRSVWCSALGVAVLWFGGALGCAGGGDVGGGDDGGVVLLDGRRAPVRAVSSYGDEVVRSVLRERALSVLEEALVSEVALFRANALEGMRWAPTRLRDAVEVGLVDENAGVRFAAGMIAGDVRLLGVREELEGLLEDEDKRVRMAGMYGLRRLGDGVSLTPLASYLSDRAAPVRRQAVFVLGELGDTSAIPLLRDAGRLAAAAGGRDRTALDESLMRLSVAEALLKLGDQGMGSVVRSALYPGTREDVEASVLAAQIIGEVGLRTAIGQLVSVIEQPVPGGSATGDPREREYLWPIEMRLASALALAKMGELGGVFVADLAFDSERDAVRGQAAFVYGWAGREIDLAKLELLMEDESGLVRVSAAAGVLRALSAGVDGA